IGRVVTGVLLAAAVAGSAAFAHLLGSVPGSTILGEPAGLPAAAGTGAPLVIRAALAPVLPHARVRPILLRPVAKAPARPVAHATVHVPHVAPVSSPHTLQPDTQVVVAAAAPPPVVTPAAAPAVSAAPAAA